MDILIFWLLQPVALLVTVVAALAALVFAVRKIRLQGPSWLNVSAAVISTVLIVGAAALAALVWFRTWNAWSLDDGPFRGVIRKDDPQRRPDQAIRIYNGMSLEVFDRRTGEPAPTVRLRDSRNRILWTIYAVAYPNTEVDEIRFQSSRGFPFRRPRVIGLVKWTYGHEGTWWYITESGMLEEYRYSW